MPWIKFKPFANIKLLILLSSLFAHPIQVAMWPCRYKVDIGITADSEE